MEEFLSCTSEFIADFLIDLELVTFILWEKLRSIFSSLTMNNPNKILSFKPIISIIRWFDAEAGVASLPADDQKKVDWFRILPLVFMHVTVLLLISWVALLHWRHPRKAGHVD